MIPRNVVKKPVSSAGFFQTIKTNWLLVVACLLLLPLVYRWVVSLIAQAKASTYKAETIVNNSQNGKSSPVIISQKSFDIFKKYVNVKPAEMDRYKAVAQKIAISLGTNVEDNHFVLNTDFFNVSAWTENEASVVKLLKTVPTTFTIVEDLYFNVFTRSRNLKTDLYKYLSASELAEVKKTFAKYGKKYL